MHICVEIGILGLNSADTLSLEGLDEFLMNQVHSFTEHLRIVCLGAVLYSPLHVVDDGQDGSDEFLSAIKDQFCTLLKGTLAIVVKLSYLIEHLGL